MMFRGKQHAYGFSEESTYQVYNNKANNLHPSFLFVTDLPQYEVTWPIMLH